MLASLFRQSPAVQHSAVQPLVLDLSDEMQISGETIGEVKTVADMHERKSVMAKHADAFIALPGFTYGKFPDGDTYVTRLSTSKATNKQIVKADVYVAACDVPGIKRLIPNQWREWDLFDNIYKLVGVPVITIQLSLLELFDKGVEKGFIESSARDIVVSAETVDVLIRKMEVNERQ
ncbi:hypothetical protein J5N97_009057 [Dioscorea zingiberensis]|uniref:cytokinin riboside 5'-monophosphate phosphoribohydrolase n=1 Tax=Dioscorea zingiberensis TaxID=325984 RepID=A0A9D5CY20_9LILI|nr:hypothetical protein J5N97_009057 [Dioscorea zingiberensis]